MPKQRDPELATHRSDWALIIRCVRILVDYQGREVRLTDERLAHILEHPETRNMEAEIEQAVRHPELVRRSRSDDSVFLNYAFHPQTPVGSKWLCVVVKYEQNDAFVVTAYLTGQPKAGETLWPIK